MPHTTADDSPGLSDPRDGVGNGSAWAQRPAKVREPSLIEPVISVRAPAMSICARDGQIRRYDEQDFRTAHGYYEQDRRVLSRSELTVDGFVPEYLGHRLLGANRSKHVCMVRTREDPTPDPALVVERIHQAGRGESISIANHLAGPRTLSVVLRISADLADVSEVRRGEPRSRVLLERTAAKSGFVRWSAPDDGATSTVRANPRAELTVVDGADVEFAWTVRIEAGKEWRAEVRVSATELENSVGPALTAASRTHDWKWLESSGDEHLDALAYQGLADLDALLLAPVGKPRHVFAAAGAPWYLTLFGRDSIWAARLLLPVDSGNELALGTLAALAGLRGRRDDRSNDEQPGKILHELRSRTTVHQQGEVLPPVYYGSMDATPLFVILLTEAFRTDTARRDQEMLLDAARGALNWIRERTEDDYSRGFVRYTTVGKNKLFNHGWKDSKDAIVGADGRISSGPIALAEVQAYAYQAATGFADLIEKLYPGKAREEAAELRQWADGLKCNFLERFIVGDGPGEPYFAMALDGHDAQVPGLTSNMGHLLGTGMLDSKQSACVARHLMSEQLNSGWGLRTRGAQHPRFNPFSYHGGAVWAHDTAIAIRGLSLAACRARADGDGHSAEDCVEAAKRLASGLVAAGQAFNFRLPELFSGGTREPGDFAPLPFPSACRPQAWSAAAGVAVHAALTRIDGC